jgi:hypothetical protein
MTLAPPLCSIVSQLGYLHCKLINGTTHHCAAGHIAIALKYLATSLAEEDGFTEASATTVCLETLLGDVLPPPRRVVLEESACYFIVEDLGVLRIYPRHSSWILESTEDLLEVLRGAAHDRQEVNCDNSENCETCETCETWENSEHIALVADAQGDGLCDNGESCENCETSLSMASANDGDELERPRLAMQLCANCKEFSLTGNRKLRQTNFRTGNSYD